MLHAGGKRWQGLDQESGSFPLSPPKARSSSLMPQRENELCGSRAVEFRPMGSGPSSRQPAGLRARPFSGAAEDELCVLNRRAASVMHSHDCAINRTKEGSISRCIIGKLILCEEMTCLHNYMCDVPPSFRNSISQRKRIR